MLSRQGLFRLRLIYLLLFSFSIILFGMALSSEESSRKFVFGSAVTVFLFSLYFWILSMVYKLTPNFIKRKEKEFLEKK